MLLPGFFGLIIGILGAVLGIGGGSLFVPLLLLLYKIPVNIAVGTSLVVVLANAISGTIAYTIQGKVDYRSGSLFALAALPGAVLGSFFTRYLPAQLFRYVFAAFLAAISLFLLLSKRQKAPLPSPAGQGGDKGALREIVDREGNLYSYRVRESLGLLVSALIGFTANVLGIGGAVLLVPLMILVLDIPVYIAAATSYFVLVFSTLVGVLINVAQGNVNFNLAFGLALGSIVGGQAGAVLSRKVPPKVIEFLLAVVLLGVAVKLLI